jgi:hypothetical protein
MFQCWQCVGGRYLRHQLEQYEGECWGQDERGGVTKCEKIDTYMGMDTTIIQWSIPQEMKCYARLVSAFGHIKQETSS